MAISTKPLIDGGGAPATTTTTATSKVTTATTPAPVVTTPAVNTSTLTGIAAASNPAVTPAVTTPAVTTPAVTTSVTSVPAVTYTATDGTKFTDQLAYVTWQANLDANARAINADLAQNDLLKQNKQGIVTSALEDFKANLKLAGISDLADTIDSYIKQDMTAAQIKINITTSDAYKNRFPGMQALKNKGMAISEGAYIGMERGYQQTLHAYGLPVDTLGTRERLGGFIANMTSPSEFESRVSTAAERVKANTDVMAALETYYGISPSSAITYLLDPTVGMDLINKEVRAAEIGAAAANAGFKYFGNGDVSSVESIINSTGKEDLAALKTDFQKAFQLANTQSRLMGIEGEMATSGVDMNAVKTVFGDQAKLLESQKRANREQARFGGGTGLGTYSLRGDSGI